MVLFFVRKVDESLLFKECFSVSLQKTIVQVRSVDARFPKNFNINVYCIHLVGDRNRPNPKIL